jgi:hypothetical protein
VILEVFGVFGIGDRGVASANKRKVNTDGIRTYGKEVVSTVAQDITSSRRQLLMEMSRFQPPILQ